jgi:carbamoyl-phosphate synthase large subunit
VPLAKVAARVLGGRSLASQGFTEEVRLMDCCVKEAVLPFPKFPDDDPVLGPEMRSTVEVMGMAPSFGAAFAKAQMGAGCALPAEGTVFISVNDSDKQTVLPIARGFAESGFRILATEGTARALSGAGIPAERVHKVNEGRPHIVDHIKNGAVQLLVNTPLGRVAYADEAAIRRSATLHRIPLITTLSGAAAAVAGIRAQRDEALTVRALQDYHAGLGR